MNPASKVDVLRGLNFSIDDRHKTQKACNHLLEELEQATISLYVPDIENGDMLDENVHERMLELNKLE